MHPYSYPTIWMIFACCTLRARVDELRPRSSEVMWIAFGAQSGVVWCLKIQNPQQVTLSLGIFRFSKKNLNLIEVYSNTIKIYYNFSKSQNFVNFSATKILAEIRKRSPSPYWCAGAGHGHANPIRCRAVSGDVGPVGTAPTPKYNFRS